MSLKKKGQYSYGDSQEDIRTELANYSRKSYPIDHYADSVCTCGGRVFRLLLDDNEGVAVRICGACETEHPMGDSADYLEDAELGEAECPCGSNRFEITVGVALYSDSEDVKWFYLGCRCMQCSLVACYGDWKNEYDDYREFLALI